nr:MAG TPA: hypothetical protein [Caudoviricetes sp.]
MILTLTISSLKHCPIGEFCGTRFLPFWVQHSHFNEVKF